jgi:hypothetical protein
MLRKIIVTKAVFVQLRVLQCPGIALCLPPDAVRGNNNASGTTETMRLESMESSKMLFNFRGNHFFVGFREIGHKNSIHPLRNEVVSFLVLEIAVYSRDRDICVLSNIA